MKTMTVLASTILLLGLLPAAWAQSQSQQPNPPDPTAHAPASQAPSTPPTFPSSQSGSQAPEAQRPDQPSHPESSGSTTSSASATQGSRTFEGQIILSNHSYLLRSGDEEYKLDDQSKAKQYAGKDVKVTGNLDRENKTIHVDSIEVAPSI
jgi:hypothetical protein